ncbi:MAG: 2-nitropropane dioxygenase [Alphaproteobacteria bacterium RIFCSPHIGHO2_12_FULL_63_12]|nr:MAG: 2-nitropropane dioxygenase [Alphaproteobacteria bacterium RIFCSPHIGHO2_12_FULL_63_12]
MTNARERSEAFAATLGLSVPILLAPMAGACPPSLSIAVAKAGGMGACGVLLMPPPEIAAWVAEFRAAGGKALQLNLWTPDPPPTRDAAAERRVRDFLAQWGPQVPETAGDATPPDFAAQFDAMLAARPTAISSIMGLYPPDYVRRMKAAGVKWFATATNVGEAALAAAAGADAIIAQGAEAGGHRGAFDRDAAERTATGLFALVPAIVDAVSIPVIAAGGISDARGLAAALTLGASAAMVGTGFLRSPEAKLSPAWSNALALAQPEDTQLTRAFSGRSGRSLSTAYVRAASAPDAPPPAPYPVQRGLTAAMRRHATEENDIARMQAWAGQASRLAPARPAGEIVDALWRGAREILR